MINSVLKDIDDMIGDAEIPSNHINKKSAEWAKEFLTELCINGKCSIYLDVHPDGYAMLILRGVHVEVIVSCLFLPDGTVSSASYNAHKDVTRTEKSKVRGKFHSVWFNQF